MALRLKRVQFTFPSTTGSQANQIQTISFSEFPGTIRTASAAINGFDARFTNEDRDLGRLKVDIDVLDVSSSSVRLRGEILLRDFSGNVDDPFQGSITGLVIADVA